MDENNILESRSKTKRDFPRKPRVIFITAGIAILGIFFGYSYTQNDESGKEEAVNEVKEIKFVTYVNSNLGFKFNHPESYSVDVSTDQDKGGSFVLIQQKENISDTQFSMSVLIMKDSIDADQTIEDIYASEEGSAGAGQSKRYGNVGGEHAISSGNDIEVWWARGNDVYFATRWSYLGILDKKVFDKILSSFTFTN